MKLKTVVFGLLLLAGSSFGQDYYSQRLGNFDYTYGPNGYHGFGQQMGRYTPGYRHNFGDDE